MKRQNSENVPFLISKRAKKIQTCDLPSLLARPCCHHHCIHTFSVNKVKIVRMFYSSLSEDGRRKLLWDAVKHGHADRTIAGIKKVMRGHLVILQPTVDAFLCATALNIVTGGGITRIREYMNAREAERSDHEVLFKPDRYVSASGQHMHMLGFMKKYLEELADHDPTKEEAHLPQGFTVEQMWQDYANTPDSRSFQLEHGYCQPLSLSTMRRVWEKDFSHMYKIPRHTRLGKCDTCWDLDQNFRNKCLNLESRAAYREKKARHLDLVKQERLLYHIAQDRANCLSLVFDGASEVQFPLLMPTPKSMSYNRLGLPLYGIACHTYKVQQLIFSPPHLTHDTNFVITALVNYMAELYDLHQVNFPRGTLLLQADNTTSQNKNYLMLAFAGLMVKCGLFEKVELHFLPVGHTHEDIDQRFGVFKRACERSFSDCYTTDDVKDKCDRDGKLSLKSDQFVLQHHVIDWKRFFSFNLPANQFRFITDHHSFLVGKSTTGEIQLLYKEWRSDIEWHGSLQESTGVPVFRERPPEMELPQYCPNPDDVDDSIKRVVEKLVQAMGVHCTPEREKWYQQFAALQPVPPALPHKVETLLGSRPPMPEEFLPCPPPPPSTKPARAIIPLVQRISPELFANREPQLGDLVICLMHDESRKGKWKDLHFWLAEITALPKSSKSRYRALWYKDQGGYYKRMSPNVSTNIFPVAKETILFSGFKLTKSNKLYADFERIVMQHEYIKNQ